MRRALVIVSAAAAVGLAGCGGGQVGAPTAQGGDAQGGSNQGGGGQDAQSPIQAVKAAYTTTKNTKSAKFTIDQATKVQGQKINITGHGASDFGAKASKLTMTSPMGQGKIQVRRMGGSVYMKLPGKVAGSMMPEGKTWMSMDTSKMGMRPGMTGGFGGGSATSPMRPLKYLRGVSKVSKVGTDTVRGTQTTHYKAKIDLDKVAEKMNGKAAQSMKKVKKSLDNGTMPVDLWLDGQGRLRQEKVNLQMDAKGRQVTSKTKVQYFDFGAPVHVSAPPKGETVPFKKAIPQMKQRTTQS